MNICFVKMKSKEKQILSECNKLTFDTYFEAKKVLNSAMKVNRNIEHGRK